MYVHLYCMFFLWYLLVFEKGRTVNVLVDWFFSRIFFWQCIPTDVYFGHREVRGNAGVLLGEGEYKAINNVR